MLEGTGRLKTPAKPGEQGGLCGLRLQESPCPRGAAPSSGGVPAAPRHQHQPTCTIPGGLLGTCEPSPPPPTPLGKQPCGSGAGGPWDHQGTAQGTHLHLTQALCPAHQASPGSTSLSPETPTLLEASKASPTVNLKVLTNHLPLLTWGCGGAQRRPAPTRSLRGDACWAAGLLGQPGEGWCGHTRRERF